MWNVPPLLHDLQVQKISSPVSSKGTGLNIGMQDGGGWGAQISHDLSSMPETSAVTNTEPVAPGCHTDEVRS
jgi:hypothetical protein